MDFLNEGRDPVQFILPLCESPSEYRNKNTRGRLRKTEPKSHREIGARGLWTVVLLVMV